MKVITIAAQKGGTAKTSTCAALGLGLHQQGKKVLYIDTDVQHNLTDALSDGENALSLADVLTGIATIDEAAIETPQGALVCASGALANPRIGQGREGLETLRNALKTCKKKYDVCIVDTPPAIGGLTDAAMMAADALILPCKADRFSWAALTEISGNIQRINSKREKPLEVLGVLPVMFNSRTTANRYTLDAIKEEADSLGFPMLPPIRRSVAVEEMQYGNNLYSSRSGAADDYMQIVYTIMQKIKRKV